MQLSDVLCHFAFKLYASIDRESSENSVYSPYLAFVSAVITAAMSKSKHFLKYLGFDEEYELDMIISDTREMIVNSETLPVKSKAFLEMLNNISESNDDTPFKYLKENQQCLMFQKIKENIIDKFPEILFEDDESLFERFSQFFIAHKEDDRIVSFLDDIKIPISILKKAPNFICPNLIWHDDTAIPDKLKDVCDRLGIVIRQTVFPQPGIDEMNAEIDNLTQGLVPNIVSEEAIQSDISTINLNSILFDAKWENDFQNVQLAEFHLYSGKKRLIKTMFMRLKTALYFENSNIQVLQLNYASSNYAMVYILNKNTRSVQISNDELYSAIDSLEETDVYIEIPRFEVEFGPTTLNIYFPIEYSSVTQIIQKVRIGNYEEGTSPTPNAPSEIIERGQKEFICNHPFLFFVIERNTKVLFLMGTITNPIAVDFKPLTSDQRTENFLASIRGDEPPFPPEPNSNPNEINTDNNSSLWDDLEKIGDDLKPLTPKNEIENNSSKIPDSSTNDDKPNSADDADLIDFMYEGKPKPPTNQSEIDFLFGSETKTRVTYPAYSPWSNVILRVPKSAMARYDTVKKPKYPKLPPLPPLLDLILMKTAEKENENTNNTAAEGMGNQPKNSAPSRLRTTPKIVEPKAKVSLSLR